MQLLYGADEFEEVSDDTDSNDNHALSEGQK